MNEQKALNTQHIYNTPQEVTHKHIEAKYMWCLFYTGRLCMNLTGPSSGNDTLAWFGTKIHDLVGTFTKIMLFINGTFLFTTFLIS